MRRLSSFVTKRSSLYDRAWLSMAVLVWFSYFPNIHFGQDSTMNFEISLTLVGLIVLALVSLPSVWLNRHKIIQNKLIWLIGGLAGYSILSVLWSVNPTRGLLTASISGMLLLVFLGAVSQKDRLVKLLPKITKVFIVTSVIMSLLAVLQFVAGIWLQQGLTLLCNGCVSEQFGFPRPNVFTIEPQFFGNLLLVPILVLVQRFINSKSNSWEFWSLVLMMLAMFLTMSRGAIYALAVGVVILFVVNRRSAAKIWLISGISVLVFAASLFMQGVAAANSSVVSESFMGAVGKSVSQLSLGVIDVKTPNPPEVVETHKTPVYDGYVEESTDVRVNRTELAIDAWRSGPLAILFGSGIGGAGVAMNQANPELIGAREIVQNEYVERLLERGLVGLVLSIVVIITIIYSLRQHKWLWSILAALLLQWVLFSGYPNALHIYLILVLLGIVAISHNKKINYL